MQLARLLERLEYEIIQGTKEILGMMQSNVELFCKRSL